MKVISAINQKGGVGKTTTVINLATALISIEKKVLVIDIDPQGNLTTGLGLSKNLKKHTINELLLQEVSINDSDVICETKIPNLDIIISDVNLVGAELSLSQKDVSKESRFNLKKILDEIKKRNYYDFIIIDCPPSLGMLSVNAMCASDSILIPVQCEFFALEGLGHLLKTYKTIKQNYNPNLSIEGILLTMYDKRNSLTFQVEEEIRNVLKELVYKTVIYRNVKIPESSSHGKPVMLYDHNSIGAECYINLAKEVIKKNNIVL